MEFILIFMILMVAITVGTLVSHGKGLEMSRVMIDMEAGNTLTRASDKINTAFLEGPGFKVNLTMPPDIFGQEYSTEIHSSTVFMVIGGKYYSRKLLTGNIAGNLTKGMNFISNVNGGILIA